MGTELNYDSITTSLCSYIKAQSTTINSGLYATLTTVGIFDPRETLIWCTRVPAVSVNFLSSDESMTTLGSYSNGNSTLATMKFEIGCHIRDIKSYSAVIIDMQKFITNVSKALRTDMTASGTFDYLLVNGVEATETILADRKTYSKNAIINVTGYKYF